MSDAEDAVDAGARQLEAIYRAQAPGLARYFRARFRGTEDPDDLVQEVFTRLAGGKPVAELRDPQAYLKRILRNLLITRKRRLDRRPLFVGLEGIEPAIPPDQSHAIELSEMQERYRACVDALPPRTREVFLLHRAEELKVKVIAERLGISSRTVEWHIAQAILRLGEALERE
ncbi:RNA polymerase sigma factor [Sphingomonas koreensis]